MIRSITLINWRSHADTKLVFRPGTNLLVGIMGSGKSSVLEGIAFAFFGTFPALEHRKLKLEDVVRLNEPRAKIALQFDWEGKEYRIERAIEKSKRGTSTEAEIYCAGALVERGSVAVTRYIASLTGVDYDLFTRAIYSEQNSMDYFLTLDPRHRKEEIDALLGLDRFEEARANIISVIGRFHSRREALSARFSTTKLKELQSNEAAHSSAVSSLEQRLKDAGVAYEQHRKILDGLLSSFESMRKKRELYERLSKESLRLSSTIDSLAKEVGMVDEAAYADSKKRLASLSEQRSKLAASIKALEEKNAALVREMGALEMRIKTTTESRARLDGLSKEIPLLLNGGTLASLQQQQKASEQQLLSMDAECKSLEREAAELRDLLQKLKPGVSNCPLCLSPLTAQSADHIKTEHEASIAKKDAAIADLKARIPIARKNLEILTSRIRKASLLSERIASLEKDLASAPDLTAQKGELEAVLLKLKEERKTADKAMDDLTPLLEQLRLDVSKTEILLRKRDELTAARAKFADIKAALDELKFDETAFESLRGQLESARIAAERMLSEQKSMEGQLRVSKEMLKLMREELAGLRQMESDINSLTRLEEELSIYKNALLETQTGLRASLVDAINSTMNELWPIFYPYGNYPSLRLQVSEKDYVFEVHDRAAWKPLESIASGGERAAAALTMRSALAMILTPRLSWLILDEPTHNLDTQAIALLSSALQTRVPEVVKQTFVITHEEGLMGSEFASSYRLTRDKDRNGETKAEEI